MCLRSTRSIVSRLISVEILQKPHFDGAGVYANRHSSLIRVDVVPVAYVNLGAALISAGRCQEAVSVLRQGSRLDGTGLRDRREHETARVSALLQLGALYSDQGRLQRALAAYREAAYSLPEHYPPQVRPKSNIK